MTDQHPADATSKPGSALLAACGVQADWSDCQRQPVGPSASTDPLAWTSELFHRPPAWVASALALRDRAVALFGIRTAAEHSFRVRASNEHEALIGTDDKHLDFRASIRCVDGAVEVITIVQIHNLLGRLYFAPVRLLHPPMVRQMLRRAAKELDPAAERP
ncbi:DUF2867 domain-containing protein [Kribbella italica]|uniref:DUF2867 domain-containing protein n=1 Tax=Kribbella italica TaxID=1540520 RepID=A0A7W9J236_9ACTN|nr:DUF2867 domain-containing protein [Kribbella italica]MBB5833622.1 hypothetical protein [Kribbella italica]